MTISVIIPTYKPGEYLWECLESLKNQKLSNSDFELILVLNGPRNPFYDQISSWIGQNSVQNFCLIYSNLPGVSNARNIGMESAKGEYICFIDDDDYVSSSYLSELLEVSGPDCIGVAHPVAFEGDSTYENYEIEKSYWYLVNKGKVFFSKAKKFFGGPCMKLIHKSIVGGGRFNTGFKNGEDSLFMFDISQRFQYVKCSRPNAIYYRRIRKGSASQTQSLSYRLNNRSRLIVNYCSLFFSNPRSYSFSFFITRIMGAVKSIFIK